MKNRLSQVTLAIAVAMLASGCLGCRRSQDPAAADIASRSAESVAVETADKPTDVPTILETDGIVARPDLAGGPPVETSEPARHDTTPGPRIHLDGLGEVVTAGFPAISPDGLRLAEVSTLGAHEERELVILTHDIEMGGVEQDLLAYLDMGEESEEKKEKERERRQERMTRLGAVFAGWRSLDRPEGLSASLEGAELLVRLGSEVIIRESHAEWFVDRKPECRNNQGDELGCGCAFHVELSDPALTPDHRSALVRVSYHGEQRCEPTRPAAFIHFARARDGDSLSAWTVEDSVALLCGPGQSWPKVQRHRIEFLLDALSTSLGRVAVWNAILKHCKVEGGSDAPPEQKQFVQPEEDGDGKARLLWQDVLLDSKRGVGMADDGSLVAFGEASCSRNDYSDETIWIGSPKNKAKGTTKSASKVRGALELSEPRDAFYASYNARAPVVTRLAGRELRLEHRDRGVTGHVSVHEWNGLSFFTSSFCAPPPSSQETEDAMTQDRCTMLVDVRVSGGPAGRLYEREEEWEWAPRWTELYGRSQAASMVLAFVMGGDHDCGSTDVHTWSGRTDLAATLNANAVAFLRRGDIVLARSGFEASLSLDPESALPRYNLACAFARQGDSKASTEALLPLLRDSKRRKEWIALIRKDKDFDRIRDSAELQALLVPGATF